MWSWKPYQSVADRKIKAEKTISKMQKKGKKLNPVRIESRKIATSFWGNAWCKHLESLSDYVTRLPRGRSYVRHGAVIDLVVQGGKIKALVLGSEVYNVSISITKVDQTKWGAILKKCSGSIASVIELLQGKFSSAVMKTITDQQNGLFPLEKEISFECDCYDWASMCKHIAAALYGIGARLDVEPELIFVLRQVNHMELLHSVTYQTEMIGPAKSKVIDNQDLSDLFGIDIDERSFKPTPIKTKLKPKIKK